MQVQHVGRSLKTTRRTTTHIAACNGICVLLAALLGHAALSAPPTASAPTIDRVGFPEDYRARFKVLSVKVKDGGLRVLTVYGNELAAAVTSREELPYPTGAVLLMEFSYALRDAHGGVLRNADGTVKTAVEHVDVMKRGRGFGEAYRANRTGEWEYAGYRLDGSYTTRPEQSAPCAACHQKAGGGERFYVSYESRVG